MNQKINPTSLVVAAILLAGLLLAGCASKPADVAKTAARIADFSLPDGYQPELALEVAGYSIVSYHPGDGHSHLYLVQAPADKEVSQAELEAMLNKAQPGNTDKTTHLTVVEKRTITIRGQETAVVISEGTNGDGEAYRQATAAFQGKGGPALLVISEPNNRWDAARLDQLIASIQ